MKQTMVQVKYDLEKYDALKRYAGKKDVSIETELRDTLERLYKKLVPADVREYIEETDQLAQEKVREKKKSNATKTEERNSVVFESNEGLI